MRKLWAGVVILLGATAATAARADLPSTQPTGPQPAGPQPAPQAAGPQARVVLVLPFETIGDAGHDWVGRAVQQGVYAGLLRDTALRPTASGTNTSVVEPTAAVAAAKSANADAVVFGSCQVVGDQLRVTGQVADAATGKTLDSLSASGATKDLFTLEDGVARQADRALSPLSARAADRNAAAARDLAASTLLQGDVIRPAPQRYTFDDADFASAVAPQPQFRTQYDRYYYNGNNYPGYWWDSGYGYPYGGYGYGYGYGNRPIIIQQNNNFGGAGITSPSGSGSVDAAPTPTAPVNTMPPGPSDHIPPPVHMRPYNGTGAAGVPSAPGAGTPTSPVFGQGIAVGGQSHR